MLPVSTSAAADATPADIGRPAMIEYHCTKRPDISMKIYDMGMKAFADDPSFALKYLSFLLSINDEPSESSPGRSCGGEPYEYI
jgi:hypothetical protein